MNRVIVLGLILQVLGVYSTTTTTPRPTTDPFTCTAGNAFPETVCYDSVCTTAIKNHIEHEFNAAFKYMYMAAKFGQYTVARPGITKFLLDSASEERSHAIQMLDYLNTRGLAYNQTYTFSHAEEEVWSATGANINIENALKEAIKMEIDVTRLIHGVVKTCGNDFHAADVFTNPILDEQHHGLRKLQGALKTLQTMKSNPVTDEGHKVGEYFFDLKLLSGEV